ncbi:MAG: MFS transporter [Nitrososphaerales archaeon]
MGAGTSVGKWRVLAFASLGHLVNDGWTAFIPVVADIAHVKGTPISVVALMSVAFYSAAALFSFHIGRWADRRGALGTLVGLGLGIVSLSFLGFFLALNLTTQSVLYASVVVLSSVAGFGTAFYHPLSATVIRSAFPYTESGKALGVSGAFGAVGSTAFPVVFVSLAVFLTQPNALALMSGIGLLSAVTVAAGLRERRRTAQIARDASRGDGSGLNRDVLVLTGVTAIRSLSSAGFTFWLATYLTTVKGIGVGPLLGLTLAALWIGSIPGQFVFGAMVDRFDNRYVLGVGSGGAALCVLAYIYSPGYLGVVFIVLFGFFSFSTFPTLLSLASAYAPGASSSANAIVWGLGAYGGNVVGPGLVGLVVGENYALFNPAFAVLAVLGLVGAVVSPLMRKPERKRHGIR